MALLPPPVLADVVVVAIGACYRCGHLLRGDFYPSGYHVAGTCADVEHVVRPVTAADAARAMLYGAVLDVLGPRPARYADPDGLSAWDELAAGMFCELTDAASRLAGLYGRMSS